jgi:hypothetical protein
MQGGESNFAAGQTIDFSVGKRYDCIRTLENIISKVLREKAAGICRLLGSDQ